MSLSSGSASKSSLLARRPYKILQGSQRALVPRRFTTASRQLSLEPFATSSPEKIKAKSIWPSPSHRTVYLQKNIYVAHRPPKDWTDWTALSMVRLLRRGTDFVTGYKHHVDSPKMADNKTPQTTTKPSSMTEQKWLTRFVFLESVAGVPGMVAGMLRHLHSLRRLKKDNGWIETLLEEAYNERMHLLTFLSLAKPGPLMKLMIIGAQGVFFNSLFIAYLISPRTCHRFVAYLEEEAVLTYSLAIQDIEDGKLPAWEKLRAPDIAIKYWKLPEGERMMKDLLLRIRADEAKHREVNHTLSNLNQEVDHNPFNSSFAIDRKPYPSKGIENIRPTGWERKEVI